MTPDANTVQCELWLRVPTSGTERAYRYQRIWIPDGAGDLVTPYPPLLHDHVELDATAVLLGSALETVGTPPPHLVVVGRSWRYTGRDAGQGLLQLALSRVGALIRHDAAGADHLCVTAH